MDLFTLYILLNSSGGSGGGANYTTIVEELSSKWPDIPYEKYSFDDIIKILLIQSQPVAEGEKVIDYLAELDENGEPVFDENGNPIISILTVRVVRESECQEAAEQLRNQITELQNGILSSLHTLYTGGNVNA